ncbi:McrB family protein [Mesoflavibacter sp.]|uniref:McrB family protein n=1 Tax=Mesoflavibacter sp. TaxID=1930902 RepID=UPI003517A54C
MHFHQKIHQFLLEYRDTHDKNFNFLVRQRTSVTDKNFPGGKFAHGLVFQGNNDYCFVALSDKSGGANATKSIGIVIRPTKSDTYTAMLEIVFPGEQDQKLITFYKELASKFDGIKWDNKEERAWLHIGEFTIEDPTLLYNWLDKNYPTIRETALQSGIDKLIPDNKRFYNLQNNLKNKLKEALEKKSIQTRNADILSVKEKFSNWLKTNETSNKVASYLRAIDILNELLGAGNVYAEKNIAKLTLFYQDLIEHQKDEKGIYYYEAAPSYGFNGFYSASIKAYIEFLKTEHGINPKKDNLNNNYSAPINQIFYGPPGTGKTFFLKDQLFDKYILREQDISRDKYFEEVVSSITWWQAIALALFEEGKSKVSDILENRWVATKANLSVSKNVRATLWGTLQMHTIEDSTSVNYKQRQAPLIFNKSEDKFWVLIDSEVKELAPEILEIKDEVDNFIVNTVKSIKHYDFVTFHQSFSYEDFIEGIKPVFPENEEESSDLGYAVEDGVFKRLCLRAKNDPNNRYAIFIDEINRGNVSAIFGELITLIEIDKRKGEINEMSVKLPYSKEEFSVPSNLDIYGTMNTADRSVEALDTALRRRFEFKEMMPNYDVIADFSIQGFSLSKVLKTINQRIELLIDRDHTIGHSYFYNVKTLDELVMAFNNKIVPLLQEYFYGDYGKIGLVLGKGFVETIKNDKITFADFSYENSEDFKMPSYNLKTINPENIIEALDQLLNNPVEEN